MAVESKSIRNRGRRRAKVWLMRCLAVLVGLLPAIVLEVSLRVLNWPQTAYIDPYVDLHNLEPLFQPDPDDPTRLMIGQDRLHLFRPVSFQRKKPAGTFRIFALGGSTTQGEPYSTETAFPRWAGEVFQLADPHHNYEVINCGGLSYASYRVHAVLREVLQYSPDLILLYTGHNEYLERRSYEGLHDRGPLSDLASWARRLRTVELARRLLGSDQEATKEVKQPTVLKREVDALLDYAGGLEDYHRGDPWFEGVVDQFAWNLREMLRLCHAAKVPIVLVKPVSNLADSPPFKVEPAPELSQRQRAELDAIWKRATTASDAQEARDLALQVLKIDPGHAGAHYIVGRIAYEQREREEALSHLTLSRDYDVCPLRAPSPILDVVVRVARSESCVFVDAEQLIAERSELNIPGQQWLVDHIHPTIEGHQLLGKTIAVACIAAELIQPSEEGWEARVDQRFREVLQGLDESYFHRALQRLEGLRLWTQGRAKKLRPGGS